ncbi:MAG: DUF2794 domain-containing protein [Pseudomonadota bacterium]
MDHPPGQFPSDGATPIASTRVNDVSIVTFHRRELNLILNVYGKMLGAGIARDYAIDHLKDRAVFSIFRRTSENPLYRVEKTPRNANRQGAWSVISPVGGTLKRGRDLAQVLKVFDRKLIRAVE